jgi:hypothetical protein
VPAGKHRMEGGPSWPVVVTVVAHNGVASAGTATRDASFKFYGRQRPPGLHRATRRLRIAFGPAPVRGDGEPPSLAVYGALPPSGNCLRLSPLHPLLHSARSSRLPFSTAHAAAEYSARSSARQWTPSCHSESCGRRYSGG